MTPEQEQKKRCDGYIEGDVVNDPKWGPITMTVLKMGRTTRYTVRLNQYGQWSPQRYTGKLPSATGNFDYEIETGTWVMRGGALYETGRGEYPSQAVADAVERTRIKAASLNNWADKIEKDAKIAYEESANDSD